MRESLYPETGSASEPGASRAIAGKILLQAQAWRQLQPRRPRLHSSASRHRRRLIPRFPSLDRPRRPQPPLHGRLRHRPPSRKRRPFPPTGSTTSNGSLSTRWRFLPRGAKRFPPTPGSPSDCAQFMHAFHRDRIPTGCRWTSRSSIEKKYMQPVKQQSVAAKPKPAVQPEKKGAKREAAAKRKPVLNRSPSFVVPEPRKDVARPQIERSATFLLGEPRKELPRPNVMDIDVSSLKKSGPAPARFPKFSTGVLEEPQKSERKVLTGHDLKDRTGRKSAQRFPLMAIAGAHGDTPRTAAPHPKRS